MKFSLKMIAACAASLLVALSLCAAAEELVDLASLLPAPADVPGWKLDGAPLLYNADNLWEYIDGSADNVLSYGFKRLIAQSYSSVEGKELKVEIYELENPLMAYGIYAQMRSPRLVFHEMGNEAFADEFSLGFWKDNYFVRVAVFEKGGALSPALKAFANAIAKRISKPGALPPESCAFAEEGLVPNSTRYVAKGVLGREEFPPAFVSDYILGGEDAKLYLSTLADSQAAKDTLDWYLSKISPYQGTPLVLSGPYFQGLGKDPYQGDVIAFRFKKWVGVLTGLKNPAERGGEIVKRTVEKLAALDKGHANAPESQKKAPEPEKR